MEGLIDGVQRIAVVRANGLGDLVFSLPALEGLRRAYPRAEITLIGRPHHVELLARRPASPVDHVEVAPPYGGVTAPEGAPQAGADIEAFFARMQARRFDLALQLHGGGANANPFTRRLGARVTAGLRARGAPPLDRWVRYTYYQPEVQRYLEVTSLVGAAAPPSLRPALTVTPAELEEADRLLAAGAVRAGGHGRASAEAAGGAPVVLLNPGASDPRRRWPVARFAAVGRALAARGFDVVVAGDAQDEALACEVVDRAAGGARSIAGRTSLGGLLGVLARARLLVSNDTGPLHLAAAVGTPTVGVYWCGNALNGGPVASHRHRSAISWRTLCPACGVDCTTGSCTHDDSFVADVPLEAVREEVDDVLSLDEAPSDGTPRDEPSLTGAPSDGPSLDGASLDGERR